MTAVDEIKSRIDIVELVSGTVKLRRTGKNYIGFCPFHPNTRTPAFVVFPESGTWRCFGQCNEGGDIFRYVMKKEGWDFTQALHYLAERAGVLLEAPTPEKQAEDEQVERLRTLLEQAVTFYRHHLLQTPAGQVALSYLQRRGLQPATIEQFGLGFAPDAWDAALNYFTAKGYAVEDLAQAGLLSERQGGGYYDRFRNRIMFPIRDASGRMAGFGARILNPQDQPKFLNSPQTRLFDKGRLLYGLDLARKSIRSQDQALIVEGYLDVIVLHQFGYTQTVSPMGTALSEEQLRLLKRFTRHIVLALDADAAGQKATLRGLEIARQTMDRAPDLTFDPHGLLRSESRLQADLRVTTLPEGMDPDDVLLRDPEEWRAILAAARPVVIHVMEMLAAGRDLEDPKVKSEIAAQVLPLIEDVANPVEREAYRQRLARLLRIDERVLVPPRAAPARPRRRNAVTIGPAPAAASRLVETTAGTHKLAQSLERHILRLLLRQPDALYKLDRTLQQAGLGRFAWQDFEMAEHQLLSRLILQALDQDHMEPSQYIQAHLPEEVRPLAEELSAPLTPPAPLAQSEPTPEQLNEDLVRTVMRLRHVRLTEGLKQLSSMQQDLQEQAGAAKEADRELMMQYSQFIRTLSLLNLALGQSLTLDE